MSEKKDSKAVTPSKHAQHPRQQQEEVGRARITLRQEDGTNELSVLRHENETLRRREAAWNLERESLLREKSRLEQAILELRQQINSSSTTSDFHHYSSSTNPSFSVPDWNVASRSDGTLVLTPIGPLVIPSEHPLPSVSHNITTSPKLQPIIQQSPQIIPLNTTPAQNSQQQEAPSTTGSQPLQQEISSAPINWQVQKHGEKLVITGIPSTSPEQQQQERKKEEQEKERKKRLEKNMSFLRQVVLVFSKDGIVLSPSGSVDLRQQLLEQQSVEEIAEAAAAAAASSNINANNELLQSQEQQRPRSASGTLLPIVTPAGTLQ